MQYISLEDTYKKSIADLGAEIRSRRLAGGWTQSELAAAAGLSRDGVMRLERGRYHPGLRTIRRLDRTLQPH